MTKSQVKITLSVTRNGKKTTARPLTPNTINLIQ